MDQRAQLLDAALACFSRTGIAGTSLRAMADEAGVTPALLHYYFGDKSRLVDALVDERLMPLFARLRAPMQQAGDDPGALVAAFVGGMTALVANNPWLPSLWVREVLTEGGALRELLVERVAPQIPVLLAGRFAAAQRAGRLNPDLDPRLLVVSLVGLTLFPAAGAPIWQRIFAGGDAGEGLPPLDADVLQRHTLALLQGGMEVHRAP
ncbi:TetR/AcrR family transcriptional regulator [Luteimonas vadosa]|uniref:TetR/AcrR family transcriptional regulator n=1 Tax=Luteimonas vadosa TaxID=1165507 RepID=A0ABP9DXK3_9GAMM